MCLNHKKAVGFTHVVIMTYKKKVRLYPKIDADLISLYKNPEFSLSRAMALSLQMCATGKMRYIRLPTPHIVRKMPDVVEFNIIIPDRETLNWLNAIPSGMRNDAIKNIVRGCLCGPVMCEYFMNDENDNISTYNDSIENTISCIRTKEEVVSEKNAELEEIQKILSKDGISPEKILDLIKREKEKETKEEIQIITKAENSEKEAEKAKPLPTEKSEAENVPQKSLNENPVKEPDPVEETTVESFAESIISDKPLSYGTKETEAMETDNDNTDDDFDLFGATQGLMDY